MAVFRDDLLELADEETNFGTKSDGSLKVKQKKEENSSINSLFFRSISHLLICNSARKRQLLKSIGIHP